jgi:hypothetical protein
MKNIVFPILLFFNYSAKGQIDTNWLAVIIEPDILVFFPDTPTIRMTNDVTYYEFVDQNTILRVTSEKNKINYYGRPIAEVDYEYYSTLTERTITDRNKLITEIDSSFEGHNLRKLVYTDTINMKPCIVTLFILSVTGFEEALYKFYVINFDNRVDFSKEYLRFYSNWDLYYQFETNPDYNPMDETIPKRKDFSFRLLGQRHFIEFGRKKRN